MGSEENGNEKKGKEMNIPLTLLSYIFLPFYFFYSCTVEKSGEVRMPE